MNILVVFALCWTNTWKNHIFQYFEWILLRQQIFTAYTLLQFVWLFQNAFKIDFLDDYQFKYLIFIKNKTIFLWKSKNSPFWDPRRQYQGRVIGDPFFFDLMSVLIVGSGDPLGPQPTNEKIFCRCKKFSWKKFRSYVRPYFGGYIHVLGGGFIVSN